MTPRVQAALLSADAEGWINPPLWPCPTPDRPVRRPWYTADVNRLIEMQLVGERRKRRDGLWAHRLNDAGWAEYRRMKG